ncbi:MAG: F0F1 ATP synthase subunit alpha [Alphaproteobacteria bacterium]|nr:F0F1 ATP synthase subunit alpha [Alphaproteobacteria bacterium]
MKQKALKIDRSIQAAIKKTAPKLHVKEANEVISISAGTAQVSGLSNAKINELLTFKNGVIGMVHNLEDKSAGVVFLTNADSLTAGDRAEQTGRILEVPVGPELLGRVINPLGQPLDEQGKIHTKENWPIERPAHSIMDRAPVDTPLQTGIKAIDSFTPIGRGQRELILGDRQTGKTAIAVDTILNQKETGVICIYCAIGQRSADTARVIDQLKNGGMMDHSVIVVANGEEEAGLQFIAPYSATSIAEWFMMKGKDVLIVYDDLTAHARAYRQMSLLLRTPPGREAYPGDIFYIHSRLLERSTHLINKLGGGSLTSLPIVSTEAGNISAYIPTNVISITDGQIYLSTSLFQKGIMPAIDTGRSVSRVGGEAQLPAYRQLLGPLKLFYSQFEELESFSKFGVQLDAETQQKLNRGHAIRLVLQQVQFHPMDVATQIAVFLSVNNGIFDTMNDKQILQAQDIIHKTLHQRFSSIVDRIVLKREKLDPSTQNKLLDAFRSALDKKGL